MDWLLGQRTPWKGEGRVFAVNKKFKNCVQSIPFVKRERKKQKFSDQKFPLHPRKVKFGLRSTPQSTLFFFLLTCALKLLWRIKKKGNPPDLETPKRTSKLTMTSGPDPVVEGHKDYFQTIFRRCVAAILGSYGTHIAPEAFEYVVLLAEMHMHELYTSLASIARIQRRSQPSLEDLALLFSQHNINASDLLHEKAVHTQYTEQLAALQFDPELEPVPDAATPFFDNKLHNITDIVPSKRKMPSYVPKWMPQLPPDHTYMDSPVFTNHVRSLQVLREQLVEEGRLAEQALQRLLGQGGSESLLEVVDLPPPGRFASGAVGVAQPSDDAATSALASAAASAATNPGAEQAPSSYITIIDQGSEPTAASEVNEAPMAAVSEPAESARLEPSEVKEEPSADKIKVKLPKLRLSMGKDKPLSFSISLGTPSSNNNGSAALSGPAGTPASAPTGTDTKSSAVKRPKPSDVFGKRPKLDIVKLAKDHEAGDPVGPFKPWDRPLSIYSAPPALPSVNEAYAAALASIEKQ